MMKIIDFNEYLLKKKLSEIKLSKKDIMSAKETLLSDDDCDLYIDSQKRNYGELKEM